MKKKTKNAQLRTVEQSPISNAPEPPGAFPTGKSPLEKLLEPYPQNFWTFTTWPLLQACFFWNGLPINWDLDDLKKREHFPSDLESQEKILKRVDQLRKMYQVISQRAKKKRLIHRRIGGEIHITPFEFTRLCAAQKWYPVVKVWRELDEAPQNISLPMRELFYKRLPTPSYADKDLEKDPKSIRQWFRKEFQKTALQIYNVHKNRWKKKLTPTEIYNYKGYKRRLKTLKYPVTQELCNCSASAHIREWIPKAIKEQRSRGRPKKNTSISHLKKTDFS